MFNSSYWLHPESDLRWKLHRYDFDRFAKAFDTVDHVILLKKWRPWVFLLLTGLDHTCVVGHKSLILSRSIPLHATYPVVSPRIVSWVHFYFCVMWMIYPSVSTAKFFYADDSALLVSGKDPKNVADKLSIELESCRHARQWMIDKKKKNSPSILAKQKVFCLAQRGSLNQLKIFPSIIMVWPLSIFSSVKYLGVTLDNTLSGDSIASNIIKKANGRLKFLYRHSNCLNFKSRETLTSALIMCYFDYVCSSWYSALFSELVSVFILSLSFDWHCVPMLRTPMELSFRFSKLFGLSLVFLLYLSCKCILSLHVFIVICMHWVPNKIKSHIWHQLGGYSKLNYL